MSIPHLTILAIGATGSIGRHVVAEALREGHAVRALVRDRARARALPAGVDIVIGDLTRPETLAAAVEGVDAIIFTHASDSAGKAGVEAVDYGGVRNVLAASGDRKVRIALMTAIGITNRASSHNLSTGSHDWKRRAERLVRASGNPYTIVRPGWFDYNGAGQRRILLLQGDRRSSGTPRDGAIARSQIAQVLVRSLTSDAAQQKTFELIAETGLAPAPGDFDVLFASVIADPPGALDGVGDAANMPFGEEPECVRSDRDAVLVHRHDKIQN